MTEVEVRKATREDCKFIRELIQELADFEKMPDGPKINYQILERDGFDTDPPLFLSYVAIMNGKVIGYALSYYTYSTWCGKAMYMEDLYVTSEYRNKHVGSKLLAAIAQEAVKSGCCRLDFAVLKWNSAVEFYKHKGAIDLTDKEDWHFHRFNDEALKKLTNI